MISSPDISDGESDSSQSDQALTPVKQFISNEARAERVKKCDERDRLASQVTISISAYWHISSPICFYCLFT